MIDKPALYYFGGKWALADWIIGNFPKHKIYVEPFGGGASILLRKKPSPVDVYNDINGDVVNFFKVLRDRPGALVRAVWFTPYSRYEAKLGNIQTDDELERARRFFAGAWQAPTNAGQKTFRGWRYRLNGTGQNPVINWQLACRNLYPVAERLRNVMIESDDALSTIERFDTPETLFYIDPPYIVEGNQYKYGLSVDDHIRLAELIRSVKGKVVLSGYPHELYDTRLADWKIVDKRARDMLAQERLERLWISPSAQADSIQPRLF